MKICTIVGIRKSGKTTTVEGLVRELKRRGHRVGTVKTVFCPAFSMDQEGSNTDRHKKAGADLIGVKAKNEMHMIYPESLNDNSFFLSFRSISCWWKATMKREFPGLSALTKGRMPWSGSMNIRRR